MIRKLCSAALLTVSVFATATDESPYVFFGLGLQHGDWIALPDGVDQSDQFSPEISLGVGRDFVLTPGWTLQTDISLRATRDHYDVLPQLDLAPGIDRVQVDNVGVWGRAKLARTDLFENVSPFVSVELGLVDIESPLPDQDLQLGKRLFLGLEFDVGNDWTIELAVGDGDFNGL